MATASGLVLSNAHVPDNLLCPVCFELPLEEVLQCKDGHIICKSCCSKLKDCPQCRIPFGKEEIRCRVFEAMLEDIKLECPFKQGGCSRKLFRNYVKTHIELCWFNYEKFGQPVHLCKLIGFGDCTFRANQGSTDTALKHFTNKHQFPTVSGSKFNLEINNFQIISGGGRRGEVQFLKPFLLDLKPDCVLLLFTVLKKEFISWLPLYLPYVNPTDGTFSKRPLFNVEFFIMGSDPYTPLSWSLSPTNISKAGSFLPDIPFQIPISKIQDFTVNGTLRVKCTVKKKELEEKKERKGKVETVQMSLSEAFGVSSRAPGNTLPVPFQMPGQSQPPPQQKPGLPSKLAKQQGMGITRSVPVLNLSKIPNNSGTSSKGTGKGKKLPSNHWDWNWGY